MKWRGSQTRERGHARFTAIPTPIVIQKVRSPKTAEKGTVAVVSIGGGVISFARSPRVNHSQKKTQTDPAAPTIWKSERQPSPVFGFTIIRTRAGVSTAPI